MTDQQELPEPLEAVVDSVLDEAAVALQRTVERQQRVAEGRPIPRERITFSILVEDPRPEAPGVEAPDLEVFIQVSCHSPPRRKLASA